ncbi:flagellar hook-associated protein FlgK [Cellulomonas sp. P24]|uniref:flagellar hook-associated protein FlgK n=1 Tax=Cellulomonas sp. P24 TaxID=2885206 RepID=UPI00216B29A5|nr:flagellar basal body rod C-terminal domain-containing protein [Cellulomonas sp. P24]
MVDRLKTLYASASTEWSQSRSDLTSMVSDVNTTASSVADLNAKILSITNAGGSANELMDKRDQLITQLSSLTGATARIKDNGTVDVLVGGNALVDGARANAIAVTGAATFTNATTSAPPANTVQIVWAANPAVQVPLSGGKLAGTLSVLAPPDASGTGGMLTEAAASYNAVATALATTVNAVHSTGQDQSGNPAGDFFALDPTQPAALGLSVAITDTTKIAAATTTGGLVDGSLADSISQLASASGSPDTTWSAFVVKLGVDAKSATSRATVAEAARSSAEGLQMAQTSVSTDEEATNMLTYQRAYEGSARVLTAIDQMLDTLINRTGMVGR